MYLIGESMTGGYGGADILKDCTVGVEKGEIAVIVGPNGAGKSTAMKAMLGMLRLRLGRVVLDGKDITKFTPQARVGEGVAFVPQTSNVFTGMSVEENLEMGAYLRRDDISDTMEQVFTLFPILKEKRRQLAGELSGGQRQQVAVGRALMTRPTVLMLDEPTAGVSPIVMDELFDRILEVRNTGLIQSAGNATIGGAALQLVDLVERLGVVGSGRQPVDGVGRQGDDQPRLQGGRGSLHRTLRIERSVDHGLRIGVHRRATSARGRPARSGLTTVS